MERGTRRSPLRSADGEVAAGVRPVPGTCERRRLAMVSFLVRRIALLFPVLFFISILTFGSGHLAPGGPFDQAGMGRELPKQIVENLNRKFHLDEPLWKQYVLYMGNFIQGDLGPSYQFRG